MSNSIIPGYQISSLLYASVKTTIYRAIREQDSRPVVIKLLTSEYPTFNDLLEFRNQYFITKNLNLNCIIKPLSLEAYGNSYILIMEDDGGIPLQEYIKTITLSLIDFLILAIKLSNILNDLHLNRIIHKDIKPSNILINPEIKEVKIIDFSIASLLPKETQEIKSPNVLEGTLAYISPEQTGRMNRGIDYRSDFYALGATLYELLTGQLPFICDDPMELVHCHIAQQAVPVSDVKPEIPQVISEIIKKLMAKNAEDRYQSALGLKYDLENCLYQLKDTGKIRDFEIGKRDLCELFLISEKLYGREAEVQMLLESFDRIANNQKSEMVLVEGPSGIGKTVVVNEVHKPITRANGYFIKGKFDQFNCNIPLSAFVQALRDLIEQLLSESDVRLAKWRAKILKAVGNNGQLLIEVIPSLERVIGKQPPVPELPATAAQNRFNLLFQKFIEVFTTKEHVLVIFLDDLQWADTASLRLIKLLMGGNGYLLLLGAYRDNEVSPAHPFMLTVEELKQAKATVNTITLAPLTFDDTLHLISDTLNCSTERAYLLTDFIYHKTQGNPFFTTQFLKALHENEQITLNRNYGYWEYDIAQVNTFSLTSDVVEFMATQLQKLPTDTRDILKLAACIGNQFDLATLAIVSNLGEVHVADALWKALHAGLILPIGETYKFFHLDSNILINQSVCISYKFLHDRVQQAAYLLIPEEQKQETHIKIGRLLWQNTPKSELETQTFAIVNQLNIGIEHWNEPKERYELARLNFIAGKKAKASTAYSSALTYFKTGIQLLPPEPWQFDYNLTLSLHIEAIEVSYLSGEIDDADDLIWEILQHAKAVSDTAKVYEVKIEAYTAEGKLLAAIDTAMEFLRQIGIEFPKEPTESDFALALQETQACIGNRTVAQLADLPEMQNPELHAALRVLIKASTSAYLAKPQLHRLLVLKQVAISVKYGNTSASAFVYSVYGLILCGVPKSITMGYEFGQLALHVLSKFQDTEYEARVLVVVHHFISHWKQPVTATLKPLLQAYTSGLDSGDLAFAGYAAYIYCLHSYIAGQELTKLKNELAIYGASLQKINQKTALNYNNICQQVVLNLIESKTNPWELTGAVYNENSMLTLYERTNDDTSLWHFFISKLVLCYLFQKLDLALECASKAKQYSGSGYAMVNIPLLNFYDSLLQLALFPTSSTEAQQIILQQVAENQEIMLYWANHAPMNHLHRYQLVEAEKYRVLGDKTQAIQFYDRAIIGAKENGYIQEEALSNELAAKFYLDWGKEKAAVIYMQEAYYRYAHWGAKAKVTHLEKCYPQLLIAILQSTCQSVTLGRTITPALETVTTKSGNQNLQLDFTTIMKAAQAISQEIELEKLLATLMQVAITSAGAQTARLILLQESNWLVVAQADKNAAQILEIPLESYQNIPQSLIYWVGRNQEAVLFKNLSSSMQFASDRYIITHQPKSVLCTSISQQGKLIGILYLENNLTVGAFTSERLQIIQLLGTQAAISLENAQLYHKLQDYSRTLEEKVEQRTQELTQQTTQLESTLEELKRTQAQMIQSEKMSSLGQMVAGVAHEINNPVSFIHGNLTYVEQYTQDLLQLLELCKKHQVNIPSEIQEFLYSGDFEFIQEDLPKTLKSMQVGTTRISEIVLSLRNFSRMDEAELKEVDIHLGINSTLTILQHRLQEKSERSAIKVLKHYDKLPLIECYAGELNQVFLNILTNAIDAIEAKNRKFTFEERKTVLNQITIRTSIIDTSWLEITIADNGIGMTDEIQKQIWNPFYTTKPVGSATGMGMSISYQIITEKHGGKLNCFSTPNQGAEFVIQIPIRQSR